MATDARYRITARDDSKGAFSSFRRNLGLATTATKLFGVAFAGVTAGGLALFARGLVNEADELRKLGRQFQLSTAFLSELGFAAKLSGTDLTSLENAIRKLQKSVGDAANGLSAAKNSLATLGFTAEELQRLSPEDQFLAIVDAMGKVEDQSILATTRLELFGRSGGRMASLLELGVEGIQQLRAEARELNISLDDEFGESSEAFNDSITRLQNSVKGIGTTIVGQFIGPLTDLVDLVRTLVVPAFEILRQLFTNIGTLIGGLAAGTVALFKGNFAEASAIADATLKDLAKNIGQTFELLLDPIGVTNQRARERVKRAALDTQLETIKDLNRNRQQRGVGIFDDDIKSIQSLLTQMRSAVQLRDELSRPGGSGAEFDLSLQSLRGFEETRDQQLLRKIDGLERSLQQRELVKIMAEVRDILARGSSVGGAVFA